MRDKRISIIAVVTIVTVLMTSFTACSLFKKKVEEPVKEAVKKVSKPKPVLNPLTGSSKFSKKTAKQRITGFVVENHPDARPQVGMDDKKYSPDIILEGEVEGGISRMFWMYADYKKLPKVIGPLRSARPPFIRFSSLFDSIFIHWGMSHSENGYVGANTVFKQLHTSHLNAMTYTGDTGAFGRDMSLGKSLEHTGRAYGKKIPAALKEKGLRMKNKNKTKLKFNETPKAAGVKSCGKLTLKYSNVSGTTTWRYNGKSKKYTSSDYQNNVKRDNILVLFDKTEYITNPTYQGYGVTYCDYALGGGKGYYISRGTIKGIRWKVKNGGLYLYTQKKEELPESETEEETSEESAKDEMEEAPKYKIVKTELKLNKGKTWIGYASSNNGGKLSFKKIKEEQ